MIAAWWGLLASGDLVSNGVVSLSRGAAGLGLAIACGTMLGVLMAWYKPVRTVFNPLVQALYPMPKSALIPVHGAVARLWQRLEDRADLHRLHAAGHAERLQRRARRRAGADLVGAQPGREPHRDPAARSCCRARCRRSSTGIRTALAFAFVLLVATELIVARQGLGYMIGWLGDGGVYDAMFAVVLTVALLGFAADRGYLMLMKRVLRWRE